MEHSVFKLPAQDDSIDYLDWADIRSAADFDLEAARPSLVKGMLLERQVSLLCGPPNLGKTSVAASIAAHVAKGEDMGTRRVRKGGVFYIAAEDPTGVLERAYPFIKGSNLDRDDFLVSSTAIDLRQNDVINGLIRGLLRWKEQAGHERILVVFDTLNLSVGDGDENSARDMSRAMSNAQRIAAQTSAHVMIIAHVPKGDNSRPRGSTALEGNCDTILVLQRVGEEDAALSIVQAVSTKQRSIPNKTNFSFEIAAHLIGEDEDGDPVTVAKAVPLDREIEIVIPTKASVSTWGKGSAKANKPAPVKRDIAGERASVVLKSVEVLAREGDLTSVPRQAIKEHCKANAQAAFESVLHNNESFDKALRTALSTLESAKKIRKTGKDEYAVLAKTEDALAPQEADNIEVIEKDDDA